MSDEKRGMPGDPPPQYEGSGYPPQQNYPPPQGYGYPQQQTVYMDHPAFPAGGYGQTNVLVAPGPMTMCEPPPPDYMSKAIFVTLCCFWPTGVFAIMKASESRSAYARGDIAGARSNANSARQLTNISIMAGIASMLVGIVIVGIYLGLALNMRGG